MRKLLLTFLTATATVCALQAAEPQRAGYPISPVAFNHVKVMPQTFWGQRLAASRNVTIPLALQKCEETGRYTNFIRAAHPSKDYDVSKLMGYPFDDTDVYKTIEGASYMLQTYPDKRMVSYIDSVLNIVAKAQEPDGYLYTARTMNPTKPHEWSGLKRWSKEEELSHELYNLGHMVEAAVAHYQATGSRKFLDIATRYADCVVREVGPKAGQACVVPGHQIAEMALAKLYLATGNKQYLDEAKFFLDYRGRTSHRNSYSQSHIPVVEQSEAVGHAVRAGYMYAGMADVAALTGDTAYIHAIDRIWQNIVGKKLYLTGGVGATHAGEAFGENYVLPNKTAYCETCAAIANVYVNYRLFLLHGESKYYDVLERTLYNGVLSGVSLDGGRFFYPNPLASDGVYRFNADGTLTRQPWFGCACCPSNISRFIPSVPGYVYAQHDGNVYVNLFMNNAARLEVQGKRFALSQTTQYPWDGDIALRIDENRAGEVTLKIRIPGWLRSQPVPSSLYAYTDGLQPAYRITIGGKDAQGTLTGDGYYTVSRRWKKGEVVRIHFDMPVRTVQANQRVEADRGMVAVERGPLVYCAEWPDNRFDIASVVVGQHPQFALQQSELRETEEAKNTFRLTGISLPAQVLGNDASGRLTTQDVCLKLIPYFAWCHRGSGKMKVWLPQNLSAIINE